MAPPPCPQCGTEIAPGLLACPHCRRLTHADELRRLSDEAERAERSGDPAGALASWRSALDRLPPDSRQHEAVNERIQRLSAQAGAVPQAPAPSKMPKWMAGLGVVGLLLWKLKFILLFLLTKAKFLLLGLTKASTFASMFLSFGVYWVAWGWPFALGLVVSIYIHEMGHVAMLRRFGIAATAPMFIPGFGALVRLKQYPANPAEDARVGLAGPLWGLGAAAAAWLVFLSTGSPIWAAIARTGAWINLFNLLPIWQLDGGRGFNALSRGERWLASLMIGAMWFISGEGLLALIFLAAALRALAGTAPQKRDPAMLGLYVTLIIALTALTLLKV